MHFYPELSQLKSIYPHIGVFVLPQENDSNFIHGYQTVNNKKLPYVKFKGCDKEDLENNIFRLYHWEKTNKQLKCPFDLPKIKNPVTNQSEEVPVGLGKGAGIYVVNDDTGERRRIQSDELDGYKANGFREGRNFAPWVPKERIEKAAEANRLRQLEVLKEKGVNIGGGRGKAGIGKKWMFNPATNERRRVNEDEITELLKNHWQFGLK